MFAQKLRSSHKAFALLWLCLWTTLPIYAQEKSAKGMVVDDFGVPLVGVTVIQKGTGNGTVTLMDGKFVLGDVEAGSILQFSYIGFNSEESVWDGKTPLRIVMKENIDMLEEVVVIGYGTTKKKDLMGAASVLSGDDLSTASNISVGAALQGKMSGINIMSSSGFPGTESNINIRGVGTFGSGDNNPLIIIDGAPASTGLEVLNPNDIESVNVLKDASSAAIYGSRAANGVIIITTKGGKKGKPTLTVNLTTGMQQAAHIPDVLTTPEFVSIIQEMRENKKRIDGGTPSSKYDGVAPDHFGTGTVWSDYIYRKAPTMDIAVSASGGGEKSSYYLSGEYLDQKGIGIGTSYNKATLRANTEAELNRFIKVGNNVQLLYNKTRGSRGTRFSDVIFNAPITPAYDPDGSYGEPDNKFTSSKNAIPEVSWSSPQKENYRIMENLFAELQFTDYLKLRFNAGLDMGYEEYSVFNPLYNDGGQTNNTNSYSDNRKKDLM